MKEAGCYTAQTDTKSVQKGISHGHGRVHIKIAHQSSKQYWLKNSKGILIREKRREERRAEKEQRKRKKIPQIRFV